MFAKHFTACLLGTTLLASAAVAQTPSATTDSTPASNPPAMTTTSTTTVATDASYQGQWRSSKLIGVNVYNDNNESLGSINELLTDKQGKISAAVIGVGGFLGLGEHNVAVPFEKIKWVNEPVRSANTATNARPTPSGSTTLAPAPMPTTPATTTGSAAGGPTMANDKPNPWYPDHAVFSASKEELKAMPDFKYTTN